MKIKKICCLILAIILSFSLFSGCDKNNDEDKESFTAEEYLNYFGLSESINQLPFENFEHLQKSFQKTEQENAAYYYVINTEEFSEQDSRNGQTTYTYSLDIINNSSDQDIPIIKVVDYYVVPNGMPKKMNCRITRPIGGWLSHVSYAYTAFPTNDIQTPITVKHYLCEDYSGVRYMAFLQNEKVIGVIAYSPELADDEYYEELFTSCMNVISGTPSQVKNKDTVSYQEEIKDFANADVISVYNDFSSFNDYVLTNREIFNERNYLTLATSDFFEEDPYFEKVEYKHLYNQTKAVDYISACACFYDFELEEQGSINFIFYSYGFNLRYGYLTYKHFFTDNQDFPNATFIYKRDENRDENILVAMFFYHKDNEAITDNYVDNFLEHYTRTYYCYGKV